WVNKNVTPDGAVNIPERWGVSDGPDDIMEGIRGWPLVYALGAPESVIQNFERVWEGHIRQFSRAKVPEVEEAQDGIYVKEFPRRSPAESADDDACGSCISADPRREVQKVAPRVRRRVARSNSRQRRQRAVEHRARRRDRGRVGREVVRRHFWVEQSRDRPAQL